MSKGSPVLQVRVPSDVLSKVEATIQRSQSHRFEGGYTASSWVLSAIREKLDHNRRGSIPRKKRKKKPMPDLSRPNPAAQTVGQRIAGHFPHQHPDWQAGLARLIDTALADVQAELARERAARETLSDGLSSVSAALSNGAVELAREAIADSLSEAVKILSGGATS